MSRIGKLPIPVPSGIDVAIEGAHIRVKGPKGELERTLPDVVSIERDGDELHVRRPDDSREARSHQGLVRSLVANMVEGVEKGYTRTLDINGVGYRAEVRGSFVRFDLGFSHPIFFELPEGVSAQINKQTEIVLSSTSKERVGQTAAMIRALRKPEPYKGKGIKYREEHIRRKAGKAGGK